MASTINASTSSGLAQSADTSGNLELQSNGSTKVTVASTGVTIPTLTTTTLTGTTVTGTITNGTAVASTSGTSIDFTSIPSWVKRITVMLSGVSTSGTSLVQVQLGTGATPTYVTTGYLGAGLTNIQGTGFTVSNSTTGLLIEGVSASANVRHGSIIITNISGNNWCSNSVTAMSDSARSSSGAGSIALGAALTAVRITTVNGTDTFDAGSINIMYEG